MKKKYIIWLNVLIGVMSFVSWIYMVFRGGMALSATKLESLKYFTVLSNLVNGGVCLWYAFCYRKDEVLLALHSRIKLIGTASVGLTFLTVMVFLGPLYGYDMMFRGANFWMHLILPVASMYSFIVLEDHHLLGFRDTKYVLVFPLIYEICYVGNILLNGIGEWPKSNDFYGFLNWGNGVGALIAGVILLVIWIISVCLYFGYHKVHRIEY